MDTEFSKVGAVAVEDGSDPLDPWVVVNGLSGLLIQYVKLQLCHRESGKLTYYSKAHNITQTTPPMKKLKKSNK